MKSNLSVNIFYSKQRNIKDFHLTFIGLRFYQNKANPTPN